MKGGRTFRRVEDLASRQVADELVVFDRDRRVLFGLNATAGQILAALVQPRSANELAQWLAPGDEHPRAKRDIEEFLEGLLIAGLVAESPEAELTEAPPETAPLPWSPPQTLWREEVVQVTHQASPPQMITNPQCLP